MPIRTTSAFLMLAVAIPAAAQVTIPFVGCETKGQIESPAPQNGTVTVPVSAREGRALASYGVEKGHGVLAPRGWHCLNLIGSSGSQLMIQPSAFSYGKDLSGPAVVVVFQGGTGSGTMSVADRIGRVFPAYRSHLAWIAKGWELPVSHFPSGPFATDKLTYSGDRKVYFRTPARAEGLGTLNGLKKNDAPIDGLSMLICEPPHLFEVVVRLPAELRSLAPVIIRQQEKVATGSICK